MKDWPIGARFKYLSPYGETEFDRIVSRVGLNSISETFTYEWYLSNRNNSNISIISSKGIIFKLKEVEIESPGEVLRKQREKKLKKLGINEK